MYKKKIAIFFPGSLDNETNSGLARLEMFDFIENIEFDVFHFGQETAEGSVALGRYYPEGDPRNIISLFRLLKAFFIKNKQNSFKLIWATSPPLIMALFGVVISKVFSIPLIVDVRDPAVVSASLVYRQSHWKYRLAYKFEQIVYRHANKVCVVTPELKKHIIQTFGIEKNKFSVVQNGTNVNITNQTKLSDGKINVFYAGKFSSYQVIENVCKSINRYPEAAKKYCFNFYGATSGQLSRYKKYNRDWLKIYPPIPRNKVFDKMNKSHIALVPIWGFEKQSMFDYAVPLKFIEAVSCGKPILLYGGTSASERLIKELHLGAICRINENIYDALTYISDNYERLKRSSNEVKFSRAIEAKNLAAIISKYLS